LYYIASKFFTCFGEGAGKKREKEREDEKTWIINFYVGWFSPK
jgi:hypothetical protein